jgi:hypothetical protein
MIVLESQGLNGYDVDGLQGGFFKKISLKNAGKFAKASAMIGVGVPPHLAVKKSGLNGYDDGLNGLKIAAALKKVTLKGAIKVVKTVAPMALTMIPVVGTMAGGIVGKVLNKVTTNANGSANLIGRTIENVSAVAKTDVGQAVVKLAAPIVKNAKASLLTTTGVIPTDAQLQTLADQKGTTAQQELDAIVAAAPDTLAAAAKVAAPVSKLQPAATNNTMLYVGGGLGLAALVYVALK